MLFRTLSALIAAFEMTGEECFRGLEKSEPVRGFHEPVSFIGKYHIFALDPSLPETRDHMI